MYCPDCDMRWNDQFTIYEFKQIATTEYISMSIISMILMSNNKY